MRLKILVVPFFIIMVLVLAIGYIQPDFTVTQDKRAMLAVKEEQIASAQRIVNNAGALAGALDSRKESEQFVLRYLPSALDQDRMIDTVNFIASQSGLLVSDLAVKQELKPVAAVEPVTSVNPLDPTAAAGVLDDTSLLPPEPVVAQAFTLTVKARGTYENLKVFFDRLTHMDRMHTVKSFEIGAADQSGAAGTAVKSTGSDLLGTYEASLDYYPVRQIRTALNIPVFQQSQLDFSSVGKAINFVTNVLPALEKPQSGRGNPFQS